MKVIPFFDDDDDEEEESQNRRGKYMHAFNYSETCRNKAIKRIFARVEIVVVFHSNRMNRNAVKFHSFIILMHL